VTGSGPLDWTRRGGGLARSTFLELFFDLVFVLALTQLSSSLVDHLNWSGAYRTLVLVMAVWWTWAITIWVTDQYEASQVGLQVLVLTNMFGVLVMAVSARGAHDGQGEVFAAAYVGVHIVRGLVLVPAARRARVRYRPLRILVWFVVSSPLWLAGGLVHGPARVTLWTLGLVLDYGAAALRWPLPLLGRSVTLYTDSIVHDDVNPISAPQRAGFNPGIYFARVPGIPKLDFRAEGVREPSP